MTKWRHDSHFHAEVNPLTWWSKTLAIDSCLVMRDGPQSLGCITEGSGAILQRAASSVSAVGEPWCRISPHELPPVCFPPRESSTPFLGMCSHAGLSTSIPKFNRDYLWTKLSSRIQGGFSLFYFPLVCIKVQVQRRLKIYFTYNYYYFLNYNPYKYFFYFH